MVEPGLNWHRVLLTTLLPLVTSFPAVCEGSLRVRTLDLGGQPLAGIHLLVRQTDTPLAPTDAGGLTALKDPLAETPRLWLAFEIFSQPGEAVPWRIIIPWDGKVAVPSTPAASGEPLEVRLAEPGDLKLLDQPGALAALIARSLAMAVPTPKVSGTGSESRYREFLAQEADRFEIPIEAADKAIRDLAEVSHGAFDRGLALFYCERFSEARQVLTEAWQQREPKASTVPGAAVDAAYFLGLLLLEEGEFGASAFVLGKAAELRPDDVTLLTAKGRSQHQAGNFKEAELALERALELLESSSNTDDAQLTEALNNLAVVYFAEGRYDAALTLHEKVLAIDEAIYGRRPRPSSRSPGRSARHRTGDTGRRAPQSSHHSQ
jgi:hypothetical protein